MWALIVEMLTSLEKEKEVVDSVLEDCVNPCILDGTNVVLSVPALLTYRIESNIYTVSDFCPSAELLNCFHLVPNNAINYLKKFKKYFLDYWR